MFVKDPYISFYRLKCSAQLSTTVVECVLLLVLLLAVYVETGLHFIFSN